MTEEDAKGAKLNMHCPYDETTLRKARVAGQAICPCCWTYFPIEEPVPPKMTLGQRLWFRLVGSVYP